MKKTGKALQMMLAVLLCTALAIGLLAFTASAGSTVSSVTVDGKTLNAAMPYLVDTGSGYVADDGETLLAIYDAVAYFDAAGGILTLINYNGGAISTSATGDLTVKLVGENSISHQAVGIDMPQGGNLTITADSAATLHIENQLAIDHEYEAAHYVGISNNFDGSYATAEKSGDSITVMGKAAVSIESTKTYTSGGAYGIGAYGMISILGNASLTIEANHVYSSIAAGVYSLGSTISVNTTGDVSITACGRSGYEHGENIFRASSMQLGAVGNMTLDWTYPEFYEECEIEYITGSPWDPAFPGTGWDLRWSPAPGQNSSTGWRWTRWCSDRLRKAGSS